MPTQKKIESVKRLAKMFEDSTIAISADFTGMDVGAMTALRKALRDNGVEFHVIKNSIAHLAADASNKPLLKDIIEGPTGIALGFEDPLEPARAISKFVTDTDSTLVIKGGLMGDDTLTSQDINALASLPSKDELISRFLGQLQTPISSLVYVLNAPISGFARVLQKVVESGADSSEADSDD